MRRIILIFSLMVIVVSVIVYAASATTPLTTAGSNLSWFTNDTGPCAAVNDAIGANDGDTTVVAPNGASGLLTCNFTAFAITPVASSMDLIIHGLCKRNSSGTGVQLAIIVNGTAYYSTTQTIPAGGSYSEVTYTWATNPNTSAEWTESHIESGSGGLTEIGARGDGVDVNILCTQFWGEVTYTAPSSGPPIGGGAQNGFGK